MSMNNINERLVFDNACQALLRAFPEQPNILNIAILTQASLRFENLLVANQTLYKFNVLEQQTVNTNLEDRLRLQDAFVISSIKICTGTPSSSTDNTFLPDTYPNPVKYGVNAAPLGAFWNATNLEITVNNAVILPKWDVYRHYNSPETQQTAALGAGSPGDQDRGSFDGWYAMEPNVTLIGSKNSILQLIMKGAGLSSVLANSRAIIMVRGVLAQNVTSVS